MIVNFDYKNIRFNLVGTQYQYISESNLYKILTNNQPDAIIVQIRPDQIYRNFNYYPVNPKTDIFSNRVYLE